MRNIGLAFMGSCLLLAAWPAVAAEWKLEGKGTIGEGGWYRVAIIRMEDGAALMAQCSHEGLSASAFPAEAAEAVFFPPANVTWTFDGGPAQTAEWEDRMLFVEWDGRDRQAEINALANLEAMPPNQVADVVAFVRSLARHNSVSLDLSGEASIVVSLKGSSAPVKAVLASCGY